MFDHMHRRESDENLKKKLEIFISSMEELLGGN